MTVGDSNYDTTESECPECEEGTLLVNSFELICDQCDHVTRKGATGPDLSHTGPLQDYFENRDKHTYDNSGRVIMPGGFSKAYEGDGIYGESMSDKEINDTNRRV